jgi:hypothetical protein
MVAMCCQYSPNETTQSLCTAGQCAVWRSGPGILRRGGADRRLVRTGDAGNTGRRLGASLIMMAIFGNISDDDVRRTIQAVPQLCRPGAILLWSRGTNGTDRNASVRAWLTEAGFAELDYLEFDDDAGERAALGSARYGGPLQPLIPGRQLFTFLR